MRKLTKKEISNARFILSNYIGIDKDLFTLYRKTDSVPPLSFMATFNKQSDIDKVRRFVLTLNSIGVKLFYSFNRRVHIGGFIVYDVVVFPLSDYTSLIDIEICNTALGVIFDNNIGD